MSATVGNSKGKKNRNRRNQPKNTPEVESITAGAETEQNSQEQLDRELSWCVQQLTISLSKPNQKLTHKQGAQAVEALRALNNPKTSLVKKRQLMRVNFGDYRKKMAQEEKQYYANMKTPTVKQSTAPEKSTFLKKASQPIQKENTVETQNGTPTETPETEALPQTEGSGFCFNFKIDTEDSGGKTDDKKQSEPVENEKPEGPKPAVNYFKMVPTEGKADFKFNFTVE